MTEFGIITDHKYVSQSVKTGRYGFWTITYHCKICKKSNLEHKDVYDEWQQLIEDEKKKRTTPKQWSEEELEELIERKVEDILREKFRNI